MNDSRRLKQRLTIIGVFALFMLPIVFALMLNLPGVRWSPFGARNHGELLQPPPLLDDLELMAVDGGSLASKPLTVGWSVLLSAPIPCAEACDAAIERLQRVRLSLGQNGGRVNWIWLVSGDRKLQAADVVTLRARYPALRVVRTVAEDGLPQVLQPREGRPTVYVVDPHGYLILRYEPDAPARDLLKDLERLLRYSKEP